MIPIQAQDSVARVLADTSTVRPDTLGAPPLPGGVAAVVRAMMNAPRWLVFSGAAVVFVVAAFVAWKLWKNRQAIIAYVRGKPRGWRIAAFAGVAVLALSAAGFGAVTWNYTQHSNEFCVSCHVMTPAFQAMQTSTVHDSLGCHSCHQQSVFVSAWQLYVWLKDRPEKIEKHAVVPNETCLGCHHGNDQKWQRVMQTAGHRVHLESDSSALRNVQCTTCHGEEIHRFVPVSSTCGQSGCHSPAQTRIVIGPMANQNSLHCVTCHQYTAELPQLSAIAAARDTLRPGANQCFSCHEMRARLAEFDLARDPHGGKCGMCHNPHTQTRPAEAIKQCATSGCHANWRVFPFHTGTNHRRIASESQRCETCHTPHAARIDASDCDGCHAAVNARRIPGVRRLPQAFDTTQALRRSSIEHQDVRAPTGAALEKATIKRAAPPVPAVLSPHDVARAPPEPRPVPPDSFEHARHRALSCVNCHRVQGSRNLTFERPRGCQICHHQAPSQARCATCHTTSEIAPPHVEVVTVPVRDRAPRPREVGFRHESHARLACTECHTTPVTMAPADSVKSCAGCHSDHHAAGRACSTCHSQQQTLAPHAPPAEAHAGCDACHARQTVALLVPDRGFCLTCHTAQAAHQAGRECSTCHFLADPNAYRSHLVATRS